MNNKDMEMLGKQPSAIRQLFEYGKNRKKIIGNDNVFDFSIGNPNVASPKEVTDNLMFLLNNVDPVFLHGYSSSSGHDFVKNAIAAYLNDTFNTNEDGKYIYLTTGAAAGLSIVIHALLNKDEEVIIFTPYWPEYKVFVDKALGKIVDVAPDFNTFLPDFTDLKNKITNKTKIVIINSPNNPTGVIYKEETIKQLASILNEKQKEYGHDIYLLSDEPYRDLIYSNEKYPFITNYYDNSIVVYSFSKSVSLPGERIGYILVGSKVNNKDDIFASVMGAGRALGYVCATTLFQYLIPSILSKTSDLSVYKTNRELLYNSLKEIGYEAIYPEGAFYLFVKALQEDSKEFSEIAKKYELLLVPSDSFGLKGYVRIAYCVSTKQIKDSIPAFKKLYDHYRN